MTSGAADTFDYVVVGGGTAGCVVATRLTEDPDVSVLLIEAGGDERRTDVETAQAWPTLLGSDADWSFETVLQPAVGHPILAARGKVLGGSGSINCMVHLRGHPADFDGWAVAGAHGWDYQSVLPYFKRSEDVPDGDPRFRGRGGPLHPRQYGTSDPVGLRFVEGARRAGHQPTADFNGAEPLGAGFPDALITGRRRESTATTYLRPAAGRANLTVHTGAQVRQLTFERRRCTGVEYVRDRVPARATATGEVVLCAGAIGSPHLMLLSGIGPADDLAQFGVGVVVDCPEVGSNLQDHLILGGIRYQAEHPLPPESTLATATLLARTESGDHGADLHVAVINLDYREEWQEALPNSFAFAIGQMRPRSRGSVRLRSTDPLVPPIIDPRYLSEHYDLEQLITGVELANEIVETGVFDEWGGASETRRLLDLPSSQRERRVRDAAGSYYHLAGTCRMGSDAGAVVDPELRVVGVDGLRVADASVMPTLVSTNSNAATIMIGEKAADLLRHRNGGQVHGIAQ